MDILEQMKALQDCKIRFKTYEGEYEGTIRNFCPVTKKVMIAHAVFLPDKIFMGNLHFSCSEIESHCVVTQSAPNAHQESLNKNGEVCVSRSNIKDIDNNMCKKLIYGNVKQKSVQRLPENHHKKLPLAYEKSAIASELNVMQINKIDEEYQTEIHPKRNSRESKCSEFVHIDMNKCVFKMPERHQQQVLDCTASLNTNSFGCSDNEQCSLTDIHNEKKVKEIQCIRTVNNNVKTSSLRTVVNHCKQLPFGCTNSHSLNLLHQDNELSQINDVQQHIKDKPKKFVYIDDINKKSVLRLPENFQKQLPSDFTVIDCLDGDFYKAVELISKESSIGVSFEGLEINRQKIPSWVSISTSLCTFTFDIQQLKRKGFDNGLRNIFQDKNIEKIIHNCREASDCVLHQFETELTNVFDTQVADFMVRIQKSQNEKISKHVNLLDVCLLQYLELPYECLYKLKEQQVVSENNIFFSQRPISKECCNFAIKNVIYLRLLKKKMFYLLMNPFYRAVNVYLNVLTNATDEEILTEPSCSNTIPKALLIEGIKTVSIQNFDSTDVLSSEILDKDVKSLSTGYGKSITPTKNIKKGVTTKKMNSDKSYNSSNGSECAQNHFITEPAVNNNNIKCVVTGICNSNQETRLSEQLPYLQRSKCRSTVNLSKNLKAEKEDIWSKLRYGVDTSNESERTDVVYKRKIQLLPA